MKILSKLFLTTCLFSYLVNPGHSADEEGGMSIPLSALIGAAGGQKQTLQSLLHATVSTGGMEGKKSDNKVAFDQRTEIAVPILGPNCIVTFKLVYDPTTNAPDFSRNLSDIEQTQSVFSFVKEKLEATILADKPDYLPQNIEKKLLIAKLAQSQLYKIVSMTKSQDFYLNNNGPAIDNAVAEATLLPIVAAEYIKNALTQGFTEFKQVFSINVNSLTLYNNRTLFSENALPKKVSTSVMFANAQKNNLLQPKLVELSVSSKAFANSEELQGILKINNINPSATTLSFSNHDGLDVVFAIAEQAILTKLEALYTLVQETCESTNRPSTHG